MQQDIETTRRLLRPKNGRLLAGVAKGIAEYFKVNVTLVRIIWIILFLPGGFPGLLFYLLLWVLIPSE